MKDTGRSLSLMYLSLIFNCLGLAVTETPIRQGDIPTLHLLTRREIPKGNTQGSTRFLTSLNQKSYGSSITKKDSTFWGGSESGKNDVRPSQKRLGFGQLVILAREEAKCLQRFGGHRLASPLPGIYDEVFRPFLCYKNSSQFTQCEICRNLTATIRTDEECSTFCGNSDKFCRDLCSSVNKAVRVEAFEIESRGFADSVDQDFRHDLKAMSPPNQIFSNLPYVFCEGVVQHTSKAHTVTQDSLDASQHFIVLKWDVHSHSVGSRNLSQSQSGIINVASEEPLVFVIEKYYSEKGIWETLGKTSYNLQIVNVTLHSNLYKWRITAVGPSGILDRITSLTHTTLNGYVKPGPPKKITVEKTSPVEGNNQMVNVLIGWVPPDDKTCFYKIALESHEGAERLIRIKEPLGEHRHWFLQLHAGTQYSVLITSRDPSWDKYSESNFTRLDFKTPTCLESYNYRFDKCAPPPPREVEAKVQKDSKDLSKVNVVLSWKAPQNTSKTNPILHYNVTVVKLVRSGGISSPSVMFPSKQYNGSAFPYILSGSVFTKSERTLNNSSPNIVKVPGNLTLLLFPSLEANCEFQIMIRAVSTVGLISKPAQLHLITKLYEEPGEHELWANWMYLVLPAGVIITSLFGCSLGRSYLQKRKVKIARNLYFQSIEERDALSGDWSIVPLTEEPSNWKLFDDNFPKEKWEIVADNLIMGDIIGQGAFGVVRAAKIPRKKLQPITLKYLDCAKSGGEKFDPEMETVAIKMLKVSATKEDREQLVKEIMTMQSLGFHPQIVGLIGACTMSRSLSLVLEYCPGGDLLTFIRKIRSKYWPTLGLSECQKSTQMSTLSRQTNTNSGESSGSNETKRNRRESEDNNSSINYADIEHSSESSSMKNSHDPFSHRRRSSKCSSSSLSRNQENENNDEDSEDENVRPIDEKDVLSYARQIAMGMEYLEKNRIVHRDLACRNCLLTSDHRQVKISDFGLSRDIYTWNVYHQKSNGKLPIKWMAIESIFTHLFTSKSDVWSYGIILWELVTLGGTPYPGLGNTELFHHLKSGYRMERPDNCSEELYALMKKCWRTSPSSRPNFSELKTHVLNMMEAAEPNLYLSLKADIPSDYFRLGSRSDFLTDCDLDLTSITGLKTANLNAQSQANFENNTEKLIKNRIELSDLNSKNPNEQSRNLPNVDSTCLFDSKSLEDESSSVIQNCSQSLLGKNLGPLKPFTKSNSAFDVHLPERSICRNPTSLCSESPKRPRAVQLLPFPFKSVNDMMIINNETYDIRDIKNA